MKTALRFHLTPLRMAAIKIQKTSSFIAQEQEQKAVIRGEGEGGRNGHQGLTCSLHLSENLSVAIQMNSSPSVDSDFKVLLQTAC